MVFLAHLLLATVFAQGTGSISGRVTDDATRLNLVGVRVSIVGTAIESFTSDSGEYVLPNAPAGVQTVEFNYIGYAEARRTFDVESGRANRLDFAFGTDIVQLKELVIEGARVGTARAINQQRAAATLTNIVASDEIGNFADQNAAESLQRVAGVSLYRDQGEGRYVVLRGLNFNYTSVKVNGGSFAGADLGDRATALDVIPSDALASIEVTKVPTPDMDGEGLGGQVNIKTKSPFDADGFDAGFAAQGQYAEQRDAYSSKFNGFVSTRFGADNKYGLLISPTWQLRRFSSQNFETGGAWSLEESPTDGQEYYVAEELQFREYVVDRERYGVNLALDGRPDDETAFGLRFGYNRFVDAEDRHTTIFDFTQGTLAAADADSATYSSLRRFGRRLRFREKDQEVVSFVASLERRFGNWAVDGQLGFSEGTEKRPDEVQVRFRRNTRDNTIRYVFNGPYDVTVSQLAGGDFFNPASYNFQRIDLTNEEGKEDNFDLSFNARYDFASVNPTYVKLGGFYRAKTKTSEAEVSELDSAPAGFTFPALAGSGGGYRFLPVPRIDRELASDAFFGNRGAFTGERIFEDSEFDDWSIDEDVTAIYVMGGITLNRLNILAGVRVERTEFSTTGKDLDLDNELVRPVTVSRDYTNTLPGIHFRYDMSEQLVLRASWSNSLARPGFGDIAFRRLISDDDQEIFVGNPALDTLEATNWDASVEYYLPSLGVVSAAVFHKQIDNFAYEFTLPDSETINGVDYEVTTFANGSDGSVTGLELAYQQELRFLPAPFDGLGLLANITFLDSDATYPTRPGEEIPFIGQSDYVGNLALTYDKGAFFARLAFNFRSERLREDETLGGEFAEDLYVDAFAQLDLTVRYRVSRNWEIYGEVINLTDEPFRVFLKSDNGQGKRLGQFEDYGVSANFGVRWNL